MDKVYDKFIILLVTDKVILGHFVEGRIIVGTNKQSN